MGAKEGFSPTTIVFFLFCLGCKCLASELQVTKTATVEVDASLELARKIPDTLFGVFFEEINHAGAGRIWAELVSNRGTWFSHRSYIHAFGFKTTIFKIPWYVLVF